MSFLESLAKVINPDQRGVQVEPSINNSSENAAGLNSRRPPTLMTVTELDRRVNSSFNKSVELGNLPFLQGVSAFIQSPSSLSETSACISVATPAAALEVLRWCYANFEDLIDEVSFQLICSSKATSREISAAQNVYMSEMGLKFSQLLKPRFAAPNEKIKLEESSETMAGVLRFTGTGIASVLRRFKDYVRIRADAALSLDAAAGKSEPVPIRQRATLYLAGVLSSAAAVNPVKSSNPPFEALTPVMPAPATSSDAFSLPTEISDALASRMALIRRRIGSDKGMWTPTQAKGYLAEFRKALKSQDPMEIAAIACEFWYRGHALNPGAIALRSLDVADVEPEPKKVTVQHVERAAPPPVQFVRPQEEELLTTDELALRIRYDVRTLRERLKDTVLFPEIHYLKPFGGRKILWRWEAVKKTLGLNEHRESA